jgi:crossover junction endodeoxyribonuclease RusA
MVELRLLVHGTEPGPQGSKRHVGNGRLIEASKKVAPWRAAVAIAVQRAWLDYHGFIVFDGPVQVDITFWLPRPATVKRELPTVPPDIDKLCRSTLDGLVQGGALKDDSLVVILRAKKRYADGRPIGADILVKPLDSGLFGPNLAPKNS